MSGNLQASELCRVMLLLIGIIRQTYNRFHNLMCNCIIHFPGYFNSRIARNVTRTIAHTLKKL